MPGNAVVYSFNIAGNFIRNSRAIAGSARKIRVEFNRMGPAVSKASRKISRATRTIRTGMGRMRTSLAGAGLAGGAGVVGSFMKVIHAGRDFEDSLADLSSITGTVGDDLKRFAEISIQLGREARVWPSEVATGIKLIASAKSELLEDPDALAEIARQVLVLKNAVKGMTMPTAVLAVTESLNQFKTGAQDAQRFVNILAAGSKIGASEVPDTMVALRKSAAMAKDAGMDFENLNAILQVLAKNGQLGAIAGTQLKTSLAKLEASGIDAITPSIVGVNQALQNLHDAREKGMITNRDLTKLFGLEAMIVGKAMVSNIKLIKEWHVALGGTNVAQEQAAAQMGTLSSRWKGIGVAIQIHAIRTFEKLKPLLTDITNGVEAWLSSLSEEDTTRWANNLGTVLNFFQDLHSIGKLLWPLFSGVAEKVGQVAMFGAWLAEKGGQLGSWLADKEEKGVPNGAQGGAPGPLDPATQKHVLEIRTEAGTQATVLKLPSRLKKKGGLSFKIGEANVPVPVGSY